MKYLILFPIILFTALFITTNSAYEEEILKVNEFKLFLEDMINNNLTLDECGERISQYKEDSKDMTLNEYLWNMINEENITLDDNECDSYRDEVKSADFCHNLTSLFVDGIHKCCFVNVTIKNHNGNYNNTFCMKIADTIGALSDVKKSFKHATKLEIDCNSFYLSFTRTKFIIIFALLMLI